MYSEVDAVVIIGSAQTSLLTRKIIKKFEKRKVMIFNIDTDIRRNIGNQVNILWNSNSKKKEIKLSPLIEKFFNSAKSSKMLSKS